MGQVQPAMIYFCGENVSIDKITESMRTNLSANVNLLELGEHLSCDTDIDESVLQLCIGAIGGALRRGLPA